MATGRAVAQLAEAARISPQRVWLATGRFRDALAAAAAAADAGILLPVHRQRS